jgi:ADP-ribosyl-[dinitrogen reductase] hydrolase
MDKHLEDRNTIDRLRGIALGAAVGDALGMPLEFGPARAHERFVRDMLAARLPAGSFTDDTEMALALSESLLFCRPLNGKDLAQRFLAWYLTSPPDVGNQTAQALQRINSGISWEQGATSLLAQSPENAGNGSLMRCYPVVLAWWSNPEQIVIDSALQSKITHPQQDCISGCIFINMMLYHLLDGLSCPEAFKSALSSVALSEGFHQVVSQAPQKSREALKNSGWVRHTVESAVWALLNTNSFEEAIVQVVNLGGDADTAGCVTGALAGARYGMSNIPENWIRMLKGEFPVHSGAIWHAEDFISLADRLSTGNPNRTKRY